MLKNPVLSEPFRTSSGSFTWTIRTVSRPSWNLLVFFVWKLSPLHPRKLNFKIVDPSELFEPSWNLVDTLFVKLLEAFRMSENVKVAAPWTEPKNLWSGHLVNTMPYMNLFWCFIAVAKKRARTKMTDRVFASAFYSLHLMSNIQQRGHRGLWLRSQIGNLIWAGFPPGRFSYQLLHGSTCQLHHANDRMCS